MYLLAKNVISYFYKEVVVVAPQKGNQMYFREPHLQIRTLSTVTTDPIPLVSKQLLYHSIYYLKIDC